jgi:hypothetical protein
MWWLGIIALGGFRGLVGALIALALLNLLGV